MTNPRDEIDDWLAGEVQPLSPPPGSLDRIRRRARQHKVRQGVFAAAGCAVVLGAAVTVPQLVGGSHPAGRPGPPLAAGSRTSTLRPGSRASSSNTAGPTTNGSTQLQQRSRLSTTTSGTLPPPNFRPTSVTFVGNNAGGVVGAVLGQAGPPCATSYCTSLAGTADYGLTWYGVSAPITPGPGGSAGVSQLRFANLRDGWAFGPALYETSGGGWPWHQESTGGQRVIDIEAAADGYALGIFGTCTGTGADYAANCASFSLYSSVAGSTSWTPVSVPAGTLSGGQAGQGGPSASGESAGLVVTRTTGYVITPTAEVISGPVSGGTWRLAGRAPCAPGQAQPSGLPSQAQLAASPSQLLLACTTAGTGQGSRTTLYTSADGSTWQLVSVLTHPGTATSLASGTSGQVVLATTSQIYQSGDGGKTWRRARIAGAAPTGGFTYIGMTNASQGVALPADATLGIYVSADGGLHWQQRLIAG